jgi:hypothetical protein
MDVTDLMQQCNGKVSPSKSLVTYTALERADSGGDDSHSVFVMEFFKPTDNPSSKFRGR